MARIPTIELKHKKSGKLRIWNKSDYDPKRDKDWKIVEARSAKDMVTSDQKAVVAPLPPVPEADRVEPGPDWRKMRWPAARQYIQRKTGTTPRSKKQAEELMAAL